MRAEEGQPAGLETGRTVVDIINTLVKMVMQF